MRTRLGYLFPYLPQQPGYHKRRKAAAPQLVVTLATVKKHVGHILGKLAVANRTQAVARARVLGLLR